MRTHLFATLLAVSAASALSAQRSPVYVVDGVAQFEKPVQQQAPDPFAVYLFPPELIMAHQREIDLQENQRTKIVSELQQAQATFLQLQWKMSAEGEKLEKLLQPAAVSEGLVLEQVDRVLAIERETKRTQVALLLRIKNALSAQQQAKLTELRKSAR